MNPPPSAIYKTKLAYAEWLLAIVDIAKPIRQGIGARIDQHFLIVLEAVFSATYAQRENKLPYVTTAIQQLDILKFLLQITWEGKYLGDSQYGKISERLFEIWRMLDGWKRFLAQKTPATMAGENK